MISWTGATRFTTSDARPEASRARAVLHPRQQLPDAAVPGVILMQQFDKLVQETARRRENADYLSAH
jgi:hypothetical protein